MKAIFVTRFPPAQFLPTMSGDGVEDQLHFDEAGVLKGGYSIIGHVPRADLTDTCLVLVEAAPGVLNTMKSTPQYLYLAHFEEGETEDDPVEVVLATPAFLKAWFAAHPAYEAKVESAGIDSVQELISRICQWHGVTRKQLREAVGV